MKYSDSNIHLPCAGLPSCDQMLEEDLGLAGEALLKNFQLSIDEVKHDLVLGNIMLFNQLLMPQDVENLVSVFPYYSNCRFKLTLLSSPNVIINQHILANLKDAGISSIKFHSYQQKISTDKFDDFVRLAEFADDLEMPIWIDASYGSLNMYSYDNLRLVAEVAKAVRKVPIVILHSGGARALEAMLLAASCDNIFLDMSFSIPCYQGSTIEKDFAFAYKKIGVERVVYGSDSPYVSHSDSMTSVLRFFGDNGFSNSDRQCIMCESLERIFDWCPSH